MQATEDEAYGYGLGLIVEGWVRIEFLCLQARIKPWAVWEDRTGEDDEAWVGLCVCVVL